MSIVHQDLSSKPLFMRGLRDVKGQSEHGPEAGTRPGVANSGNRLKNTPAKVGRLLSCL